MIRIMNSTENLEVSIFKDIDHEKTIIAAIMDPDITDGVGPMCIRLVPRLKEMTDNLRYTGKVWIETEEDTRADKSHSQMYLTVTFDADMIVFGGTAYHLHKINDKSPFAHILSGIHDVDVHVQLVIGSGPKFGKRFSAV